MPPFLLPHVPRKGAREEAWGLHHVPHVPEVCPPPRGRDCGPTQEHAPRLPGGGCHLQRCHGNRLGHQVQQLQCGIQRSVQGLLLHLPRVPLPVLLGLPQGKPQAARPRARTINQGRSQGAAPAHEASGTHLHRARRCAQVLLQGVPSSRMPGLHYGRFPGARGAQLHQHGGRSL